MDTTSQDLSVESIEAVLVEKEAALAKEQAMLEGLRDLLGRMGYELVPARSRRSRSLSSTSPSATPRSRGRGRPRKETIVLPPSGDDRG